MINLLPVHATGALASHLMTAHLRIGLEFQTLVQISLEK
jgi:hypothetical protein